MAKPVNEKRLKSKVRRAKKEIREATREVQELLRRSKRGTLEQRRLDSGLRELLVNLRGIPDHWNDHI